MFLSNPLAAAAVFFVIVITAGGCSWLGGEQAKPEPPLVSAPESSIPFETREPGTYQADFVTISDGSESKTHFAKKDQRWRFDLFESGSPSRTMISTEKILHIDHPSKVYAEAPSGFPERNTSAKRAYVLARSATSSRRRVYFDTNSASSMRPNSCATSSRRLSGYCARLGLP